MTAQTDLLYSETEDDLRAAVRALLADRAGHQTLLDRIETDSPYVPGLWKSLAGDIGAAGLLVPEALGGQGATHREAAVVLEELGRAVTPLPYLTGAVVATETLLALAGEGGPAVELLAALASGERVAVLAVPLSAAPDAEPRPGPTVAGVADAAVADVLLVPRADGLYAVPAGEATIEPQTPLDLTRPLARVTTEPGSGTRLADGDAARAAVRRGLLAGAGLLASEQLGLAEWCLEETVRYTRERHQFNRPVGSFQALKHRMAQLWLDLVGARAVARAAADALATGSPDAPLTVAVAQAYCSRTAVRAAEECVQLHGGIGMTWEHPAHLALKRAKSDQIALGSTGRHQDVIADLMDLQAPV
ncbi:acyl-CoA dehydrogenase family protein [Streptomyces nymphaeiformis]|uniref:Alkylation response protein AidB-like acyl-CoA dehydrogenase n=1 Tax=Streptomyces nymphaeiformis TaxID=2663842 RepID=A0A7W7TYQ8_9ACTN|nr:acyl-CoA dehydrogenase family protein [Streptomyces nymphaeiformis]MBB4980385.1 alkylation response protein AidB-like acyl-CoA dehydrogenase [Streptomyces nymphaeiformis]